MFVHRFTQSKNTLINTCVENKTNSILQLFLYVWRRFRECPWYHWRQLHTIFNSRHRC